MCSLKNFSENRADSVRSARLKSPSNFKPPLNYSETYVEKLAFKLSNCPVPDTMFEQR